MPLDLQGFALSDQDLGLEESELVFPVEERKLLASSTPYDVETEIGPGQQIPDAESDTHKCIVRTDTDQIVGVVGSGYRLMPNAEYFSVIEQTLRASVPGDMWEGVQVRDSLARGGAFCRREYVFPAYAEQLRNSVHSTQVGLRVIAWNSYDGGTSAGLVTGLIDFYCTNGMVVGKNIQAASTRHSSRMSAQALVPALQRSIEATEEMLTEVRRMAMTPVQEEQVVELLERSFSAKKAGSLMERFGVEAEVRGYNVFALLSAMTYYSSHDSEEFPAQGREGTSPQILHQREEEVRKITDSALFRELMA